MDPLPFNESSGNSTIDRFQFGVHHAACTTALFSMAVLSIYFGSLRSRESKHKSLQESVSFKDAAMFPFLASGALVAIYLAFKLIPVYYINFFVKLHFSLMGTVAMSRFLSHPLRQYFPSCIPNRLFRFEFTCSSEEIEDTSTKWKLIESNQFEVQTKDMIGIGLASLIGIWYFFSGHWIANNCIAITIAILGIELVRLNKFQNAALLLGGLFFYDVFWVFGTSVMVTVAQKLDAPIKVTFPRDFLIHGVFGKDMSLLGLGDIVVPGLFIAMLLRFDTKLNRQGSCAYFYCGYIAYGLGLICTFIMMFVFKHAQPALLYLVPACLGCPFIMALCKNDLTTMLDYEDDPDQSTEDKVKSQ